MKNTIFFFITIYQKIFSPDKGILKEMGVVRGSVCVFYPTCSEYTKKAIQKYGVFKGVAKGFRRIIRCHPWQKNHIDEI